MGGGHLQVTTAFPARPEAERLARLAVESRLAAAVHLIGPIRSTYRWRGAVHEAEEWLCVARTTEARFQALADLIAAEHPYEVPEISAVPITHGSPAYLDWIGQETTVATDQSSSGGSSSSGSVR
jgi:periplasmic divalent cation tolerance protein